MALLDDRVCVVVGVGPGMGRDAALRFAAEGADVVLAARSSARLDTVAAEVRAQGRRALCVPTDATDDASVAALVDATVAELRAKGIKFRGEPKDEGWGKVIVMVLPGGVEMVVYEPGD